jgi:uncharacterized protein YjbI with pentapeptide repeats
LRLADPKLAEFAFEQEDGMSLVVVFAVLIVVLSVIPGIYLWWPSREESAARSDLGVALMTGAVIAFAVLGIQVLIERNNRERDETRQAADAQQNFELTLSLQDNLTGIRLDGRDLRRFYLYNKVMRNAELNRTDLREATLTLANLSDARMRDARLGGAIMDRAVLTNTKLERANLHSAILAEANMEGAVLADATLIQTDFTSANLLGVDFRGANLEGASLAGANIIGADMSDARVNEETTFGGAVYNSTTVFPRGIVQSPCPRGECEAH